jgi:alanine dehydrogenase
MALANRGYRQALLDDAGFMAGLSVHQGQLTCADVAQSMNMSYVSPMTLLGASGDDLAVAV